LTDFITSQIGSVLHHVIDEALHLLLIGYAFGNGMDCGWIDLLGEIEQKVEISILESANFDVFISLHVLPELFLSRLVSNDRRELSFLDDCKFIVLGSTMSDLDQQKLRLELSDGLPSTNEGRVCIILSS